MITIVYAHEPEIRGLRNSLPANFKKNIKWHRWKSRTSEFPADGLILNAGFAGRLSPELSIGDVVLVREISSRGEGKTAELDSKFQNNAEFFAESKQLLSTILLTAKKPVLSESARNKLHKATRADIVDMEALDIYKLAKSLKMQMISFKIISDNADEFSWNSVKQNSDYLSDKLGETIIDFLKFHHSHD